MNSAAVRGARPGALLRTLATGRVRPPAEQLQTPTEGTAAEQAQAPASGAEGPAEGTRAAFPAPADAAGGRDAAERCEVCGEPVAPEHRHLLDLRARVLRCACRACAVLFGHQAAGGATYRLVPDRRLLLTGFTLDDPTWASLRIPVQTAFVFRDSAAGRAALFYPSPAGAVESPLDEPLWAGLVRDNPALEGLADDVEALLVNRTGDEHEHWIVPVDDCYALVGLLRTHWKGFAGGPEVWAELSEYFAALRRRSTSVPAARRPS
uniref:DUF5947 family protein n=1 Tax=Nonomuraea pusilla TaxID=46177 RepID=UPI000A43BC5D|nr:DUF5947 family protein [Nonomuraea pusilla]